jgi:hypothetical protein
MKKTVILLLYSLIFLQLKGQILFTSYTGYVSGYSFTSFRDSGSYYDASINPGLQYGFDLEYKVDRLFSAGISYLSQKSTMPVSLHFNGNIHSLNLEARVRWLLFGGTSLIPTKNSEFFFATHLGAGFYRFSDSSFKTDLRTRFAWAVSGGCNFFTRGAVGLSLRLNGLFSTHPLNKGLPIPGLAENLVGYTYVFQLSGLGGIVIRFGVKSKPKTR